MICRESKHLAGDKYFKKHSVTLTQLSRDVTTGKPVLNLFRNISDVNTISPRLLNRNFWHRHLLRSFFSVFDALLFFGED